MSRWKQYRDDEHYRKAHKRLSRVGTGVVTDWAETSVWAAQAGLEGFQQTHDPAALDEFRRGVLGLLAAADVLLDRSV